MADIGDLVKSVGDTLGTIFRHLLPGALALYAFAVAKPTWFSKVIITESQWLIILGILALVIGNAWFIIHRYCIQQVIDMAFWALKAKGGPQRGTPYHESVADHVWKFFSTENIPDELRRHIRFRTSSVVLMYIVAEVAITVGLIAEKQSPISTMEWWILASGILLFIFSIWQNYLTRRIEGRLAEGRH